LLSAQNAVVADLYRNGEQVEAITLNYDLSQPATLRYGEQQIALPPKVFTITPMSFPSTPLLPRK
jgi:hypothetical protein